MVEQQKCWWSIPYLNNANFNHLNCNSSWWAKDIVNLYGMKNLQSWNSLQWSKCKFSRLYISISPILQHQWWSNHIFSQRYQQYSLELFRPYIGRKRFRESTTWQIQQVNRSIYWMLMFKGGSCLEKIIILLFWYN